MDWNELAKAVIVTTITVATPIIARYAAVWIAQKARAAKLIATDEQERQLKDDVVVAVNAVAERTARTVKAHLPKPSWVDQQSEAVEITKSIRPTNEQVSDYKLNALVEAALPITGQGASGKAQPSRP